MKYIVGLLNGPDKGDWTFSIYRARRRAGRVLTFSIPQDVGITYDLVLELASKELKRKLGGSFTVSLSKSMHELLNRRQAVED